MKLFIKMAGFPASGITPYIMCFPATFITLNLMLAFLCSPYAMLYIHADTGIPGLGPWSGHDPGLITHRYHYWLSHLLPSPASTHPQPTYGSLRAFLSHVKYTGLRPSAITT